MNAYVGINFAGSGKGGKIIIENPNERCLEYFKSLLTFKNPDYIKKVKMNKWVGNTPQEIKMYAIDEGNLVLPMGVLNHITKNLKSFECVQHIDDSKNISFEKSRFTPYDYQEQAINVLCQNKIGVLVAKTGAGKTQIGLETIARKQKKALWLTHTKDLLKQSYERSLSILGVDKNQLGIISEGKVEIGSHITFATVQTMHRLNLQELSDVWGGIFVDECQRVSTSAESCTMFEKVLNSLNSSYRFGITATPYRADGFEKSMFALLGDVIHEVSLKDTEKTTCHVEVIKRNTEYEPCMDNILNHDGTISYTHLVKDVVENKDRNYFIAKDLNTICKDGYTLVLSDRIAHLEEMARLINHDSWVILTGSNSKKSKEQRSYALENLNNGKTKIVFATWKLAKEGLDIPNLLYLVQATPQKDKATVIQACGRVARTAQGKEKGTVLDYVDNWGMFKNYSSKRNRYYREMKFDIA